MERLRSSILFVKSTLEALPQLRPVILLLKKLLLVNNLNDLYTGGVSSYSLFIMLSCVASIQS
jgi:DNA polymerase sigma